MPTAARNQRYSATIKTFQDHSKSVFSCAYNPDGRSLLSASEDHSLRLWDAASGECLWVLEGHRGVVRSCTYSPDGRTLLSASEDGSLSLWDNPDPFTTQPKRIKTITHFKNQQWETIDNQNNRIAACSSEAWRWLGWNSSDPNDPVIRYPAETFGPLPVSTREIKS